MNRKTLLVVASLLAMMLACVGNVLGWAMAELLKGAN